MLRKPGLTALALIALAGAGLVARLALSSPPPRLVLLYAPCTVNRSFLAPYDPAVEFTPNIAAFAAQGVVFERHWTETGQSGVAYASLLAGTQADGHGVWAHPSRIPSSVYLITEAFADDGYETFSWTAHGLASARYAYAQGVPVENVYDGRRLRASDPGFLAILKRLRSDPDYKAFVLCNFHVTHGKYHKQVPAEQYGRFLAEHPEAQIEESPGDTPT